MPAPSVLEPLEVLATGLPPTDTPPTRWVALPWRSRVVEAISTYLPLLVVGMLALGSWWLVKNTPVVEPARAKAPPRHVADYTMERFSIQRFTPEGPLRAQIEGVALRHYPDTDTFEIDRPQLKAIGANGSVILASAERALSNADATEVQLIGDARVTQEPAGPGEALSFRGEFLHAFLKTEQVRSHLPAVVTRGGTVVRADAFDYDNLERTVAMRGRVRASFPPPAAPAASGAR